MICKKCGTEVSSTTFWCPKCGADLTAEEPSPAQGKKRAPRSKRSRNNEAGGGYDGGGYDGGGYDGGGYDGGGYDGGGYDGGGYDGGGYDGGGFDGGGYDGGGYDGGGYDGGYDGGSYSGRKAGLNPRVLVLALIGILLAAGIAVACILMFPLKMTAAVVDDGSASALGTNTLELTLDSNQPIFSVKYAVNPDNPKDAAYQKADSSGFLFRKTLRLKDLTLEPGQTEIQLRVGTLFGTRYVSAGVFKEIGQAAEPDSSALVSIGKGLSLVSNELILVFDDAASDAEIQALLDNCGGQIVGRNEILGEVQVRFGSRGEAFISDLKSRLEQEPLVRAVYYDLSCQALPAQTPNDPEYDFWDTEKPAGNNWAQEAIYLPEAWDAAGRQTVKIGLIDSPVQLDHEDLQLGEANNTFLPSADFASLSDIQTYFSRNESGHVCSYEPGTGLCCFCTGKDHGTHVAGLIAAQSNNGLGVAGADWNCTLYTASGWFYSRPTEGQLKATMTYSGLFFDIATLVSGGCRVVSISMAETEASEPNTYESSVAERYENMMQRLEDRGYDFLIVKAAGNNGDDAANYSINRVLTSGSKAREHTVLVSAADPNVVPVRTADDWMSGASHLYTMAAYSNYGPLVDVAAPGTEVYSTLFGDRYGSMSGTSMAAPLFAGVAGLVYSTDASLSYDQVKAICCRTEETYCARGGEVYPLVSAKGAVDCAQQFSGQLPDANTPALGFISGLVQDALSEEAIDEMSVFITNVDTGDKFYSSVRNGTYECFLAPGSYTAEFASNRYSRDVVYGLSVTEDITTYVPLLNMVPDSEEAEGSISGSAINAFNAETIPYATLTVRKGVNNRNGDIVTEITADGNGNYSLDLDSGNYTFTASANGFMTSRTNILVLPGVHRDNQNCSLTPQLREGEMRIVLTWGEFPNDLDSHLVGPGEGERFHIFFAEKQYAHSGVVYDNLDVDDTLSYGPETTTVYRPLSGTYTFYVHNYSFQSALPNTPDARSLALSGAQVVVYLGGMEEPVVFNVPNQEGTLWTVFSVTDGVITPINAMSFHGPANTIGR